MSAFSIWMQSNWYGLGTLLTRLAFLIAGVWFARNFFQTLRSFQEQLGALLKLSITAAPPERHASSDSAKHSLADASPYWLTPSPAETISVPELIESGPGRLAIAWSGVVVWLKAPMSSAEIVPWRRVLRWLQAPANS